MENNFKVTFLSPKKTIKKISHNKNIKFLRLFF
jgi:hypothetical protein